MTDRERLELLRRIEPLSSRSDATLRSLLPFVDEVCVPPGVVVAQEGRLCHEFFIVASGRLETCARGVASGIGPGEAFGWKAMRDRGRHDATVRAISPAHLLVMSHEQFRAAEALAAAV
jgi:CRP-like cAMP-binding protein